MKRECLTKAVVLAEKGAFLCVTTAASETEGLRKVLGVMQKDSKRFSGTGGWGFEVFKGDSQERVFSDAKTACFDCHAAQIKSDYVFSRYRK